MEMESERTQVCLKQSEDRTKTRRRRRRRRRPDTKWKPGAIWDVQGIAERSGDILLSFEEYHDWTYGEIMANKPNYVVYIG